MLLRAGHVTFDIDGIVFDKDGTLISLDSYWLEPARLWVEVAADGSAELFARLGDALGLGTRDRSELPMLVSDGAHASASIDELVQLTRSALENAGVAPEAAHQRARRARDRAAELSATLTPEPIGDVRGALTLLDGAGLQLAVATTDDTQPTLEALSALGVASLIRVVVAADGDVPPKPDPSVLSFIAAQLGTSPERLLMVGDSQRDADTARAGGAAGFVLVSPDGSARITADAVVPSIADLSAG
ncbi:MAG: HAD family hydrolase [Acidimicrobiia bacterium]